MAGCLLSVASEVEDDLEGVGVEGASFGGRGSLIPCHIGSEVTL